jgi:hypothetical protein
LKASLYRAFSRVVGTIFCAAWVPACAATPDPTQDTAILTPDFGQFAGGASNPGVHTFLERRCGTLDCHGQTGRAFRLFSSGGLRLPNDAGLVPGVGADTPEEIYANYLALVGVQPEETSRVVSGIDPPTTLLVVAKPLGLQTHKGGQELAPGEPGAVCLESWLMGHIDLGACSTAALVP